MDRAIVRAPKVWDGIRLFVVNAFTDVAYTGNPAAVCVVPASLAPSLTADDMQCIAVELNQAETVFVLPGAPATDADDAPRFTLRWFTKETEVAFCGHATLAAAHALLSTPGFFPPQTTVVRFASPKGPITVSALPSNGTGTGSGSGRMRPRAYALHLRPTRALAEPLPAADVEHIAQALSLPAGAASIRQVLSHRQGQNLIFVLRSAADVAAARLRRRTLMSHCPSWVRKITITARWTPPVATADGRPAVGGRAPPRSGFPRNDGALGTFDIVSRLFAPWIGIDEDAVSGATHAILALFWFDTDAELRSRATAATTTATAPTAAGTSRGRVALRALQCSDRGGVMDIEVDGSDVSVSGPAVTVYEGVLRAPPPSKL